MKCFLYILSVLCFFGVSVYSVTITPTDVINNWTQTIEPMGNLNQNGWSVSGSEVLAPDHGLKLSNFVMYEGTFSGTFRTTGSDDDVMGFVFGYQNDNNHIRFGWDSFDSNSGYGDGLGTNGITNVSGMSGVHGIRVIQESAGTNTFLFQDPLNGARRFVRNTSYNFSISYIGTTLSVRIDQGVTNLLNFSKTGVTLPGGQVGIYTASQSPVYFSNLEVVYIPEPATFSLLGLVLAILIFRKK